MREFYKFLGTAVDVAEVQYAGRTIAASRVYNAAALQFFKADTGDRA